MIIHQVAERGLAHPPHWLASNTHYLTIMGSEAYGTASENSDVDLYGWCIPPKELMFPHLAGVVPLFGTQLKPFEQWQQHHVKDPATKKEYDFTVYSIAKYFQLVMDNNPNMIDSLFTPPNCVVHCTRAGELVRENRRMFLHKGAWTKFKGYAYAQIHKAKSQQREGKRVEIIEKHGYDVKFAAHCVRLLNEVEQLLTEGDIDLQRNSEQLKSIRRGEWTLEQVEQYFVTKERELETAYTNSKLPPAPDEEAIKQLMLQILEEHYGNLDRVVARGGRERLALLRIAEVLRDYETDLKDN